ncbi:chaplin family protein [Nonomuraea lactucae]|uniref:chaplin family protein n=1 Tax=Nonomuraea lactucae TaxID=2249762 RepID=UPI0013B43083|nr:chaplin family protein [Nonomuraea lactucae]
MSFGGGTALADTSGDNSIGGGNQVDLPISLPIDISGNSVGVAGESRGSSQGGASVENTGKGGIANKTSGDSSVLGGNQVNAPISAPVNACGNAVSLFGSSDAGCKGGASVKNSGRGGAGGNRTTGDHSVLGGNQVTAPITAPINACGNAVAIFGDATAGCKGGASVKNSGRGAGGNTTSGRSSVLGGNQVIAPISAPINVCGNAVAAFGEAFAGCKGGASVKNPGKGHGYHPGHGGSTGNDTDGRFAAGSGNQVIAPISLPITACGNAVGNASAGCKGGASVESGRRGPGAGGNTTTGRSGVLAGNQVVAPITAPINVCGNAVAVLGEAFAGCRGGASVKHDGRGAGGNRTSGRSGVLAGNQVVAPITAPINACGNAVAALGLAEAHCKGGASVSPRHGSGAGGNTTSGRSGVLAGNQVVAPITAPINVCGNAVAVLGDAAAGCLGGARVGKPVDDGHHGYKHFAHSPGAASGAKAAGGMLPALPAVPVVGGVGDVAGVAQQMRGSGLPVVGGVSDSLGLPALPGLPGLPGQPVTPVKPVKPGKKGRVAGTAASGPLAVADPATSLVSSTPVGGAVTSAARGLPVGDLGLMSAARPAGLTGMNTGALFALVLGAMCAGSAVLFAATRRFRLGRT